MPLDPSPKADNPQEKKVIAKKGTTLEPPGTFFVPLGPWARGLHLELLKLNAVMTVMTRLHFTSLGKEARYSRRVDSKMLEG